MFSFKWPAFLCLLLLCSCSSLFEIYKGGDPKVSLDERLEVFKQDINNSVWSLEKPVDIFWSKEAIPFIKAKTDRDLFYSVGLVQAHLRGTQLEMFRLLSQGRVSEVIGKRALPLDIFLRTIDLGKATDQIIALWSEETKIAASAFVEGLNDYHNNQKKRPLDMRLMGMEKVEPWTVKDLVYVHRLMGLDINWKIWKDFMKVYRKKGYSDFNKFWNTWVADYFISPGSKDKFSFDDLNLMNFVTEAGSNSFAVSGKHTVSGKPIVAGDPHLGITMPSYWMFLGLESPSYKIFGVGIPSFPIPVMGRTKNIAWTGTNMWGVNSFLYDVSDLDPKEFKVREEVFNVRFGDQLKVKVKDTKMGPLVSETDFFKSKESLALHWAGHKPSLEFEAMLKVAKANDVFEFREALKDFSVAAINYIAADKKGNIIKVHATHLPVLKNHKKSMILKPENKVVNYLDVTELPVELNPKINYVVSANEFNKHASPSLCWFCSTPDRALRIADLLQGEKVDFEKVKKIHTDVFSSEAQEITEFFKKEVKALRVKENDNFETIKSWDFNYTVEKRAPYLYEELIMAFAKEVYEKENLDKMDTEALFQNLNWKKNVIEKYQKYKTKEKKKILAKTFKINSSVRPKKWGDVHKITVVHPLSRVPLVGGSYRYYRAGYPGSSNTVMKAAHSFGKSNYKVNFGANLRIFFDLSDENENYAVLLGGQDGFLSSKNFFDQTQKWLKGDYIKIPFTAEAIKNLSHYKTHLR